MSAYRAGATSSGGSGDETTALDQITRWLPGDAITLYIAGIAAFEGDKITNSITLLVVMWVVAVGLVLLGAIVKADPALTTSQRVRGTIAGMVLTAIAFGVWTLTVPGAGWQRWEVVTDYPHIVGWGAGLVGVLFGLAADPIMRAVRG